MVAEVLGDAYTAAGFKVTAAWDGQTAAPAEQDLTCHYLYTALSAEDEAGNIAAIKATGGYYLIAVIVDNIPADLAGLTLTFTPYAVGEDGNETVYTGQSFVYSFAEATVSVVD